MPTRASKRKASAPQAQGEAAGKRAAQRSGTGGRRGGAAAPRKAAGGSRAAGAAAAPAGPPLYVVRCKRVTSKCISWDEDTFTDCWGDEGECHAEEVESCATSGDGVWFHDAAYSKWQHPAVPGSGPWVVSTEEGGQVVVFQTLEAANERAAAVFADMLVHLPEWLRPAPPPAAKAGRKRRAREESEDADEEEEEEEEEEDESSGEDSEGDSEGDSRDEQGSEEQEEEGDGSGAGGAGRTTAGEGSAQEDWQHVATVLPGGRVRYQPEQHLYCDPYEINLKNRFRSWLEVEVMAAARGG